MNRQELITINVGLIVLGVVDIIENITKDYSGRKLCLHQQI